MEIVEDLGMARKIRREGLRQRIAFGKDLVRVHWAEGAMGVVRITTKNMFSAFGFRISLLLVACAWLLGFCVLPGVEVVAGVRFVGLLVPGVVAVLAMVAAYRAMARYTGISAWNVLLAPFAAILLMYAMVLSMATTLSQGGVMWRGTFYSLKELREHVAPLW